MKQQLIGLVTAFFTAFGFAQEFEPGYYIDNAGARHEVSIIVAELEDLYSKSILISVRDGSGSVSKVSSDNITEIGIANDMKFRKYSVLLDDINLYQVKASDVSMYYQPATVFFNVLVEGKASLFAYESPSGTKYFYQVDGLHDVPKQLEYKKYKRHQYRNIEENTAFRQQLRTDVACEGDPFGKFVNVEYSRNSLVKIFTEYNQCQGQSFVSYTNENKSKVTLRFSALASLHFTMPYIDGGESGDPALNYSLGAEMEVLLPKRNLGFFVTAEVEFVDFEMTGRAKLPPSSFIEVTKYTYNSRSYNFFAGLRYHSNRAARNHFFVDAGVGFNHQKGEIVFDSHFENAPPGAGIENHPPLSAETNVVAGVGAGYFFMDRIGVALRYETPRRLLGHDEMLLKYSQLGVLLSYKFY